MKTSFSMYVRLHAKAALALAQLLGETSGQEQCSTYWSPQGYFTVDDEANMEEVARHFWAALFAPGDNLATTTAVKQAKDGVKELGVCGEHIYYGHDGDREMINGSSAMTRWAANAGLNVGKANLVETQVKVIHAYEEFGEEVFVEDFMGCLRGEPSALNSKVVKKVVQSSGKEPLVKIGAEDDPRISGGPFLGYVKESAYSIHPMAFLLAMHSLPLFAFRVVQRSDDEGDVSTAVVQRLLEVEGARSSYFSSTPHGLTPNDNAPSMEFGSAFIFPIWMEPQPWNSLKRELFKDQHYIANKNTASLRRTLTALKANPIFQVYSIFFTTKADSSNSINYHLCLRFPHGEDELSYLDSNETGSAITRITGHSSLDAYLQSEWASIWNSQATSVRGRYGAYQSARGEEKDAIYERLLANLSSKDDGSVEFAVAMNLRLLRVGEVGNTMAFTDTLAYGEDVVSAALNASEKVSPKINLDGIRALQYDLPLISLDRVRNLYTILWIFPDDVLRGYRESAEPDLHERRFLVDGKPVSLRGLSLLHGWGK